MTMMLKPTESEFCAFTSAGSTLLQFLLLPSHTVMMLVLPVKTVKSPSGHNPCPDDRCSPSWTKSPTACLSDTSANFQGLTTAVLVRASMGGVGFRQYTPLATRVMVSKFWVFSGTNRGVECGSTCAYAATVSALA